MDILDNTKKYFWAKLFLGIGLLQPVFTLFFLHRGLDYQQIFMLMTAIVVSMFFFEVPTGIISDKFGRKISLICGFAGNILFNIGLFFAQSFLTFLLLYIFLGIVITFLSGSDEALIYDSLKQKKKQKEMKKHWGKITSSMFLPIIILAPIASIIAKDLTGFQFKILILGNILFGLIALIISFTLVEPKRKSGSHKTISPSFLFKSSVHHIKNSPKLIRLFMNKTLILIPGMHVFNILWQPYFQNSNIPVSFFGTIMSIGAIILFFSLRNVEKITKMFSNLKLLFYTALLPLLAFVIGALFKNILSGLIFYFIIRILVWIRDPIFSQFINDHIESHNRATILSSLSMIDSFFDIIIFLSIGFITNLSITYSFIFSAIIMAIALIFFRITDEHIKVEI